MTVLRKATPDLADLAGYPWGSEITILEDPTSELLERLWELGYRRVAEGSLGAAFRLPSERAAGWASERAAKLVTAIDEESRSRLRDLIAAALAEPETTREQLADRIRELFDGMAEYRADMIARTETAFASGTGDAAGFRDTGVQYVLISDGDDFDAECLAADGAIWTLEHYEANVLEHPNCSRSASAVAEADVPEAISSAT